MINTFRESKNHQNKMEEIKILLIVVGIAAVGVIGYFAFQSDQTESITEEQIAEIQKQVEETAGDFTPTSTDWLTSGPFQIDKSQYLLGENIFLRVFNIPPNEKGQVAFLRPLNETHYAVYTTYPFDGETKNTFNQYFTPGLTLQLKICTVDDLIGTWKVVFRGTDYENLSFEIINDILPGSEEYYEPAC